MPESVTDRPTKAHEYVFLLSKQPRYFFDAEAVREPFSGGTHSRGSAVAREMPKSAAPGSGIKNNTSMASAIWGQAAKPPPQAETLDGSNGEAPRGPDGRRQTHVEGRDGSAQHRDGERWPGTARNVRSVWEIATQPYPEAHFATFPEALPERCIKAGCPEQVCVVCGKPRERILERVADGSGRRVERGYPGSPQTSGGASWRPVEYEGLGWSDCGHDTWRTGVVLDPFMGSGTVALVARRLSRRSIGVELNPEYAALCARRVQQLSLLAEGAV